MWGFQRSEGCEPAQSAPLLTAWPQAFAAKDLPVSRKNSRPGQEYAAHNAIVPLAREIPSPVPCDENLTAARC